jgi:hypothetical protein
MCMFVWEPDSYGSGQGRTVGSFSLGNWLPASTNMREIPRVAKKLSAFKEELYRIISFSCDLFNDAFMS